MYKYDAFQHCCSPMNECLDPECNIDELSLIEYSPDIRQYAFVIRYKDKDYTLVQQLLHCPWCGAKLPEKLSHKMEEVLEAEYGITAKDWDSPKWNDDTDLPEEFKTDEWWKKRRL
jgi:hypothetical protein